MPPKPADSQPAIEVPEIQKTTEFGPSEDHPSTIPVFAGVGTEPEFPTAETQAGLPGPTPVAGVASPLQPPDWLMAISSLLRGGSEASVDLVLRLLNAARSPGQDFWVVTLPDAGEPEVTKYQAAEDLVDFLSQQVGRSVHLNVFLGFRFSVSAQPKPVLRTHLGEVPLPKNDVDELAEREDSALDFMGPASPVDLLNVWSF